MSDEHEQTELTPSQEQSVVFDLQDVKKKKKPKALPPHVELAQWLHETAFIYALYGALDGLSLSYSMVKYYFDLFTTGTNKSSSDLIHEWMSTPQGAAIAASETVTIVGFSLLANTLKKDDPNAFNRYIATTWPYARSAMKALKNGYKGVRSSVYAANIISGQDLGYMILPVGLLLGSLSLMNRLWLQHMFSTRKNMMGTNDALLKEIQALDLLGDIELLDENNLNKEDLSKEDLSKEDLNKIYSNIIEEKIRSLRDRFTSNLNEQEQFLNSTHIKGFVSQFYSGFVDGLYLYMGVLGISTMAPQLLTAMAVVSSIFAIGCITTRMYEEYIFQNKLVESQLKVDLALRGKALEGAYSNLLYVCREGPIAYKNQSQAREDQAGAYGKKEMARADFVEQIKKNQLIKRSSSSTRTAILAGIKHGLEAYSAIASILFATSTIYAAFYTALPPLFIISTVLAGLASVIGGITISLYYHYNTIEALKNPEEKKPEKEIFLKASLENKRDGYRQQVKDIKPLDIKFAIAQEMQLADPSPQFFFQEIFEVVRSFFSGIAKGQKTIDYTLNPLQEPDEQGHYQDTPVMLCLAAANSVLFSVVLTLRALARGFGKKSSGEESWISNDDDAIEEDEGSYPPPPPPPSSQPALAKVTPHSEPAPPGSPPPSGPTPSGQSAGRHGFFPSVRRIQSTSNLQNFENSEEPLKSQADNLSLKEKSTSHRQSLSDGKYNSASNVAFPR